MKKQNVRSGPAAIHVFIVFVIGGNANYDAGRGKKEGLVNNGTEGKVSRNDKKKITERMVKCGSQTLRLQRGAVPFTSVKCGKMTKKICAVSKKPL